VRVAMRTRRRPAGSVVGEMKMTRTEELSVSLAPGATGKAGNGQILTLIVVAVLAGVNVRAEVDLGLVVVAACLMGVLPVLDRRQFCGIVEKLRKQGDGSADHEVAGQSAMERRGEVQGRA
jgi:hypothetical protein